MRGTSHEHSARSHFVAARGRVWSRVALLLLCCALASGCLVMPNRGTPVFVDLRAGDYWSGEGLLLEVSEDRTDCLVAVRDRALIVHERWVPCVSVHRRVH